MESKLISVVHPPFRLSEKYNIPQITVKSVVEEYLKIEGEEGDKMREAYEVLKLEAIEKARVEFEAD